MYLLSDMAKPSVITFTMSIISQYKDVSIMYVSHYTMVNTKPHITPLITYHIKMSKTGNDVTNNIKLVHYHNTWSSS